jgi:hypothetical protein
MRRTELIARLAGGNGSGETIDSFLLTIEYTKALGLSGPYGYVVKDLGAAVSLIPEEHDYLLGRVQTRPNEPPYGCTIYERSIGAQEPRCLADGESWLSPAAAVCIAVLRLKESEAS